MSDWSTQAADTVEKVVVTIRDRTVVPAQKAGRAVVFGLLASFFVLTALVLLAVVFFRGLSLLLPTWAAWLVLGGIFVIGGMFCWARRTAKE
jgi:hypothetical protein